MAVPVKMQSLPLGRSVVCVRKFEVELHAYAHKRTHPHSHTQCLQEGDDSYIVVRESDILAALA